MLECWHICAIIMYTLVHFYRNNSYMLSFVTFVTPTTQACISRPILDIFTCKPVLNEHSIASRTLIPRSQTTEQLKSHNKFQQLSPQTSFQLKFIVHCWFLSPKRAKFSLYLMCLPVDRRFQFEYTKEFL